MKIGNLEIDKLVFLAPMAGITDMAFRKLCREHGAGIVYSEMVSCKAIHYQDTKTQKIMVTNDEERPVAVQIFGCDPEIMAKVVEEKFNFREDIDIIDINMGCPAPKIVKSGAGSALMKNPELIGKIVKAVSEVSNKPVTVKIRKGWDENSINAVEVAKIAEANGASAVAVHGRTREEFYSGEADWDIIKAVKEAVKVPVIGNGDIFEPEDAVKMMEYTGCDAVMVGRGARGNPWLFERAQALIDKRQEIKEPTPKEVYNVCKEHLILLTKLKGEKVAIREMRKHMGWYIKGMKNSAEMRAKVNVITDMEELLKTIEEYFKSISK